MRDHTCIVAGVALVLVLIYEYFMDRVDLLSKALRPSGMAALDPLLPACPGHLRLWQVRKRNIHLSAILMENNRQSAATPLADSRRAALRLLIKAFVFLLPFWAAVVLYLHDDPYMSLHRYRVYDSPVVLNELRGVGHLLQPPPWTTCLQLVYHGQLLHHGLPLCRMGAVPAPRRPCHEALRQCRVAGRPRHEACMPWSATTLALTTC